MLSHHSVERRARHTFQIEDAWAARAGPTDPRLGSASDDDREAAEPRGWFPHSSGIHVLPNHSS